jgi:hydrogenase maturation protease
MLRILIIGIGNPLQGDDGLGRSVARDLSRELARDNIQIFSTHQLTPEISELVSRADLVLLIDAARGEKPGTLNCVPIEPSVQTGRHSHSLSPAVILKLAQELYQRCPPAYLLTITGESFDTGETLSPPVSAALPALKAQILQLIDLASKGKSVPTGP